MGMIALSIGVILAALRYFGVIRFYSQGGWSVDSLAYSAYETLLCTGLCIGLLVLFREMFNKPNQLMKRLSFAAFLVYIIHVPILVILQYTLGPFDLSASWLFALTTIGGAIVSFALGKYITDINHR
jgi:glucans biosynthesis protein C